MTGEEFLQLNQLSRSSADNSREEGQPTAFTHGIGELASAIVSGTTYRPYMAKW